MVLTLSTESWNDWIVKFHQTISPIGQIVEKDISVSRRVKMANLLQKERRYFVTRSSFCAVYPGIGYNAIIFSSRLATNIINVILQCSCIFNQRNQIRFQSKETTVKI